MITFVVLLRFIIARLSSRPECPIVEVQYYKTHKWGTQTCPNSFTMHATLFILFPVIQSILDPISRIIFHPSQDPGRPLYPDHGLQQNGAQQGRRANTSVSLVHRGSLVDTCIQLHIPYHA